MTAAISMTSPGMINQLTAAFGSTRLPSCSDDDVFDEPSPTLPHPLQFLQSAPVQPQMHTSPPLHMQHPMPPSHILLQQRYPQYARSPVGPSPFAQLASPQYAPALYPFVDPFEGWLNLAAYSPLRNPIYDTMDHWAAMHVSHPHRNQRPKKNNSGSQVQPAEKKVEEVDLTTLTPRQAIMKAKIRLANLSDWKNYTKNNTWTPEIVLGKPFAVPINIKFLQLIPDAKYVIGLGFALREDTPGLMSYSEQNMQWNSIEGAVHHMPRKGSPTSSNDRPKPDVLLLDSPPDNITNLAEGKSFLGSELMEEAKEFTDLIIVQNATTPNQISLRPYYKYSPCLYLSLMSDDEEDTISFTRKVMIHDIKMIPVEHYFNLLLSTSS